VGRACFPALVAAWLVAAPAHGAEPRFADLTQRELSLPLRAKSLLTAPALPLDPATLEALIVAPAARFLEREGCMLEDEATHLYGFVFTKAGALIDVFPLAAVASDQARVRRRLGTLTAKGDLTLAPVEIDCVDTQTGNCALAVSDRKPVRFVVRKSGNVCASPQPLPNAVVGTFEDAKSREQLVIERECDGKFAVSYRSRAGKALQSLAVTGSQDGGAQVPADFNGARGATG